jgi:hypothetical protein
MTKKEKKAEKNVEPENREEQDLEEEDGELLPDREAMSILPTGAELLRGPFPDV